MEKYNEIAIEEFKKYLELPQAFKEKYIPIYSPGALKIIYITNPIDVFTVANCARGERSQFLNIEEIFEKFLDNF